MQIIDLTKRYQIKYIQEGNRKEYENSFPNLFHHYYQFWANRESNITIVNNEEIQTRKIWINRLIERLQNILEKIEIDSSAIDCVYLIGVGTTNGHAYRYNNKFHVWLPLETYTTERLTQVFVTHEIIHSLHYHYSSSFYFNSKDEQLQLSRQLITEGLATFLTKELLGISDLEALWADYLDKNDAQKWQQKCQEEERNLFRLIYENYYQSNQDLKIFYASNPDNIYQFRSGYYAGLKLIENYVEKDDLTVKKLLRLPRDKFEKDIFNLIQLQL